MAVAAVNPYTFIRTPSVLCVCDWPIPAFNLGTGTGQRNTLPRSGAPELQ